MCTSQICPRQAKCKTCWTVAATAPILQFVVAQLYDSVQDAPEILTVSIQLTETLLDSDDKSWIFESIEQLLFPVTQLLKGLSGHFMLAFFKVVENAAVCVQLMHVQPVSPCFV